MRGGERWVDRHEEECVESSARPESGGKSSHQRQARESGREGLVTSHLLWKVERVGARVRLRVCVRNKFNLSLSVCF